MNEPVEIFHGVVRGHEGVSPGPASGITYKVLVNFPLPTGPQEVRGVAPCMDRWPDQLKVVAIKPGTAVFVASVHGKLQLMARELPHFTPCVPPP
jgi:hypothetical protein